MGLFTDMARAQKNINGFDTMSMPANKLGKRWLSELDNVRRGRMQAEQIAEAMAAQQQQQQPITHTYAPGDIVNGHRLDWTGTEWVWTPLSR